MSKFHLAFLRSVDWGVFVLPVFLVVIGVMAIYSSSYGYAIETYRPYLRQLLFFGAGLFSVGVLWFVNYRTFKKAVPLLYVFQLLLLALVLIVGKEVNGAKAWFSFRSFQFQPVEFSKLVMILVFAKYFSEHYHEMHRFRYIVISGLYVLFPLILVLLQPDLGSALVFIFIWLGMLFMGNANVRHLLVVLLVIGGVMVGSWFTVLKTYQKERILCLFHQYDANTICYNTKQALIAIGSGGLFGKGFGHGSQSQLHFLPEQHTDFIFAVIAEELGFVGAFLTVLLFALLLWRLFSVAKKADSTFGKLYVMGVIFLLIGHIFVNIGMNIGIFPIMGIPLPFVSYGGSMLLIAFVSMGIVGSVVRASRA